MYFLFAGLATIFAFVLVIGMCRVARNSEQFGMLHLAQLQAQYGINVPSA